MNHNPNGPRQKTAQVRLVDGTTATVWEPSWCLGEHDQGGHLADLLHDGPELVLAVDSERGPVELLRACLTQSSYAGRPEDRVTCLAVSIGGGDTRRYRTESAVRSLMVQLAFEAGRLGDLAAELGAVLRTEAGR
ncbi:MAG: hypothetical protein HOZ81_13490 [Streptomyces sp.]|nr:hypothetical protein [Streptomyces sp.]